MAKRKPVSQSDAPPQSQAEDNGAATAVAEPPVEQPVKRGRGRPPKATQPMLNDDPAFVRNKRIEDLALAYEAVRDERMSLLDQEVELKEKLTAAMEENKLDVYPFDGRMVIFEHIDEKTVKVKKKRAAKQDGTLA
jgi:hypothetical protein